MLLTELDTRFTDFLMPRIYDVHKGYKDHIAYCQGLIDGGNGNMQVEGELDAFASQNAHKALVENLEAWLAEQGAALPDTPAADVGVGEVTQDQ